MWAFFQELGVIDAQGRPTEHFGDPVLGLPAVPAAQGRHAPGRGRARRGRARRWPRCAPRGVLLAEGHGAHPWDLEPALDREIRAALRGRQGEPLRRAARRTSSRRCPAPCAVAHRRPRTATRLHPPPALGRAARRRRAGRAAQSLRDAPRGPVRRAARHLRRAERAARSRTRATSAVPRRAALGAGGRGLQGGARAPSCCRSGRVRAGYRIGEVLFGALPDPDVAPRHPAPHRRAARLGAPRLLRLHHRAHGEHLGPARARWTTTSPAWCPVSRTRRSRPPRPRWTR